MATPVPGSFGGGARAPRGGGAGRGATVWLTGLSGSGKTTLAVRLFDLLHAKGECPFLLDGDDLREGLNADLGFTAEDREENVRRVGEVALLLAKAGHVVLAPVISPYAAGRAAVRSRHDQSGTAFVEVHVATPLEVCEARDPKGLYGRARAGLIERFTGVSDPYEAPLSPDIYLDTDRGGPDELAAEVAEHLSSLLGGAMTA